LNFVLWVIECGSAFGWKLKATIGRHLHLKLSTLTRDGGVDG
jgi:hypothetical protein